MRSFNAQCPTSGFRALLNSIGRPCARRPYSYRASIDHFYRRETMIHVAFSTVRARSVPFESARMWRLASFFVGIRRLFAGGSVVRLILINPNTTQSMTSRMVESARLSASSGWLIDGVTASDSVPFIDGYHDLALASAAVARCVVDYEEEFDVAVIACFGDPGLYSAREVVCAPVVGIAEASFALAMSLGHRFGIITTIERAIPNTLDLLCLYGVERRCAAIEPAGIGVLELNADPLSAVELLEAAGRRALAAGAEVLCLGCGAMVGIRETLEERLEVPVIEESSSRNSSCGGASRAPSQYI